MEERYIRNLGALTEQECAMLRTKAVFVAGCGGLGGYLIEHLGHLAKKGERITDETGMILIADKVNQNRIEKVRIVLPEKEE